MKSAFIRSANVKCLITPINILPTNPYQQSTNTLPIELVFSVLFMAIYYFNASVISRSAGRSATASAAYRAAERIVDERTGEIHDYRKKKGVDEKFILAPNNAPDWTGDRSLLWNEVELLERRKDSQVAREIKLAIPVELNKHQQIELVKTFATEQFVSKGMVADVTFHDLDSHNPHAHIMLTMRNIDEKGFSLKKNRDWNKRELLEKQREAWAKIANLALSKAGVKSAIDHRTLEAQGINRIPQIHLGAAVTAMMKRGIVTFKEERYREIELANLQLQKWEFHLELLDRMESIYKNSPELDSNISDSTPTQQQTVEPSQVSESSLQPDHDTLERPTSPEIPSAITLQQQQQVIKTASRFLHLMGEDVWNSEQGYYHLMTNHRDVLVIRAKDGREEILRYQDGLITNQGLTSEDVEKFKKINALLDQQLSEVSSRQKAQRSQPESELEL